MTASRLGFGMLVMAGIVVAIPEDAATWRGAFGLPVIVMALLSIGLFLLALTGLSRYRTVPRAQRPTRQHPVTRRNLPEPGKTSPRP